MDVRDHDGKARIGDGCVTAQICVFHGDLARLTAGAREKGYTHAMLRKGGPKGNERNRLDLFCWKA